MNERKDFYVGYLPHAPRGLRKLLRIVSRALLGIAALVALTLVFGLQKLPRSVFEFGQVQDFEGRIQAGPYPTLLVQNATSLAQYLLVAEGKHGMDVTILDGKTVKLQGTRIYRDGMTMLEVIAGTLHSIDDEMNRYPPTQDLGTFTLVGEIVDSKCYLGVMNPGHTKVHRECAVRCISGGVPPMLIARDATGNKVALQLVSASGAPVNQDVLDFVAEPIEISGQVVRTGEQLFFKADPKTYRRK